jgi:hypothetical protein
MSDITFEQVFELAKQLPSDERAELVERLQDTLPQKLSAQGTRELLLTEFERKKASGAFHQLPSLRGKYAKPDIDVSAEEIQTYLHEIGTEWEQEMDEFFGDD